MKNMSIVLLILLGTSVWMIIVFNQTDNKFQQANPLQVQQTKNIVPVDSINKINEIPLPEGYERIETGKDSFAEWLRNIKLKKNNIVYLYDGAPKDRQDLHFRVLDISTGKKDLQQCADCIMRLWAEYYFAKKSYDKITFPANNGTEYNFENYACKQNSCYTHECLLQFLETVFNYCGTYTVAKMTNSVSLSQMRIGDVFVKAGSPGHAMIVVDMAVHKSTGQKIFLLAQGYMPAQDMHIVINPMNTDSSPWYELNEASKIITPGWVFESSQLRR